MRPGRRADEHYHLHAPIVMKSAKSTLYLVSYATDACVGLHLKCHSFSTDFNRTWKMSINPGKTHQYRISLDNLSGDEETCGN
jgi:hypothetical protein